MKSNIKNILLFILSLSGAAIFFYFLIIVNSYIFLDPIADEMVKERFISGQIVPPVNKETPIDIAWPLASIIFFVSTMAAFWFLYGLIIKKKAPRYPSILVFILPVIIGVFTGEFYFILLYLLMCFLGARFASMEFTWRDKKRQNP